MTSIANNYLPSDFETAFRAKFGSDLPETLNGDHRILIVGSEIDSSSERIIKYLSDTHGVNINAATFQYFQLRDSSALLARVFLIEPSEVELRTRTKGTSQRRPNLSYEELQAIAAEEASSGTVGRSVRSRQASSPTSEVGVLNQPLADLRRRGADGLQRLGADPAVARRELPAGDLLADDLTPEPAATPEPSERTLTRR